MLAAGRVHRAELDLRVGARAPRARSAPSGRPRPVTSSSVMRSWCCRWMSEVEMNTCRYGRSATRIASTARWGSPSRQRASAATAIAALRLAGDPLHGLEIARRGGREAGLDHVDLEAHQLARDLELLGSRQAGAGSLLAVAQGRVEDADGARRDRRTAGYAGRRTVGGHRSPSPSPTPRGAAPTAAGVRVSAAACAWPARTVTGLRNAICGAQLGADLLDRVVAVGLAHALEVRPAAVVLGDPVARERAVLDVLEDVAHDAARLLVDDPRAGHVVAVLGGVADARSA